MAHRIASAFFSSFKNQWRRPSAHAQRPSRHACPPLALPTIGIINALVVGINSTVFVATDPELYVLSPAGVVSLHAGSRSETGYQDS